MPDFNSMFDDVAVDPDDESANSLSALLFGLAGSGKTSLAVSASKVEAMQPVLFLDTERNGLDPARRHGDSEHMTIVPMASYASFVEVKKRLLGAIEKDELPYKTIIIDTVDKLQEYIVTHWEKAAPSDGFARWAQAYREVVPEFFDVLHGAGLNVILTTHAAINVDPLGETLVAPTFEGKKTLARLPSMVNLVGYMSQIEHNGDIVHVLQSQAAGDMIAKKPLKVPAKMGNPTFQKIWDATFSTDN